MKVKWYKERKRIVSMFHPRSQRWINCIKISTANSIWHELKKTEVCYEIREKGHYFLTEAFFRGIGTGRCDVVDLDEGIVYEILDSEKLEEAQKKAKKYPLPVEFVKVR